MKIDIAEGVPVTKRIKVVETRTYYYTPDLNDDCYTEPDGDRDPATTIEEAMELDKQDVENKVCDMDDVVCDGDYPEIERVWEIVDAAS